MTMEEEAFLYPPNRAKLASVMLIRSSQTPREKQYLTNALSLLN